MAGLPSSFLAWESHNDEIKVLPKEMENLARSESCAFQVVAHIKRPIYGVQFHPEVEHTEYGVELFKNFVSMCKR